MRLGLLLRARYVTRPRQVEDLKQIRVAVIGTPNVGKSSLTNKLVKSDICAVSKVIDTTRQNWVTKLDEDQVQLVVVDSPGLIGSGHAKKMVNTHSESKIMVDPEIAFRSAQHDVTAPGCFLHHRVLHLLHRNPHIPSSLVLNKCDLLKQKHKVLEMAHVLSDGIVNGAPVVAKKTAFGGLDKVVARESILTVNPMVHSAKMKSPEWTQAYNKVINKATHKCSWLETKKVFQEERGWPHFQNVFMVSCETGQGVDALRKFLVGCSESVQHPQHTTNVNIFQTKKTAIISEHVRSAFLNSIPADIAYKLSVKVTDLDHTDTNMSIRVTVYCEKERWQRIVNQVLQRQTYLLQEHFTRLFQTTVCLEITPKVRTQ